MRQLWIKHFQGTGFDERNGEFYEAAAEILLSRTVDAFQYYLADIIAWALWRVPDKAQIKDAAKQLQVDLGISEDDAIRLAARRFAERLSFGGFNTMVEFIEKTFDVALKLDPTARMKLRKIVAARNMIAHNHAQKNHRYCRDVGEPASNVGQSIRPSLRTAKAAAKQLSTFVAVVDLTLCEKLL